MKIELDLRPSMLPVRDQRYRPTCMAFAASDAHGFKRELNDWLSPEYLYHQAGARTQEWNTSKGLGLRATKAALEDPGHPLESICPYQDVRPTDVTPPKRVKVTDLYQADSTIALSTPADAVYEKAKAKSVLVLVLRLTKRFHQKIQPPFVIDLDESERSGRHAVLLAGLATRAPGQKLFLIKNSWGSDWADQGYVWLTQEYVNEFLSGTLEIKKVG